MKDYIKSLVNAMNNKMIQIRQAKSVAEYDKAQAELKALMEEYNRTVKTNYKKVV